MIWLNNLEGEKKGGKGRSLGENEKTTSIRILFLFLPELDSFVWLLIYIGEKAEVNSYLGSKIFNAGK